VNKLFLTFEHELVLASSYIVSFIEVSGNFDVLQRRIVRLKSCIRLLSKIDFFLSVLWQGRWAVRRNALRNLGVHTSLSTLRWVERRRVSHMVFRIHMLQPWLKAGCIASRRAKVEVRNCPPLIGQGRPGMNNSYSVICKHLLPRHFVLSFSRDKIVKQHLLQQVPIVYSLLFMCYQCPDQWEHILYHHAGSFPTTFPVLIGLPRLSSFFIWPFTFWFGLFLWSWGHFSRIPCLCVRPCD
jgi:hypothetical protein